MLVTLVLLAILTLGAVSATDDAISDGLAVSDDGDSLETPVNDGGTLSDDEDPEFGTYVEDSVIDENDEDYDEDDSVAGIVLPENATGTFKIDKVIDGGYVNLFSSDVPDDIDDDDHWDDGDYDNTIECEVCVSDLIDKFNDKTIVDGTILKLYFVDDTDNEITDWTLYEKVIIDDGELEFEEIEDSGEDTGEEGVIIEVHTDMEFNIDTDLDSILAEISVVKGLNGNITISVYDEDEDEDIYFFNKALGDFTRKEDSEGEFVNFTNYKIALGDLNDLGDFLNYERFTLAFNDGTEDVESQDFDIDYDDDDTVIFYEVDEEDGVVIWVDEENVFNLTNPDDFKEFFAFVSVHSDLNGNITINIYDEDEDEDICLFNKALDDIANSEDDEDLDDFTVYKIALKDLSYYNPVDGQIFSLAFNDDMEGEIDSREYVLFREGAIVRFEEFDDDDDDDEDDEDHGELLENVIFLNGNILLNDEIIIILKENLPKVDDEFEVFIGNDNKGLSFKLSQINSTEYGYILTVSDLKIEEVGDETSLNFLVQFYKDDEEAYYAETDDEGVAIYTSPYIYDEFGLNTFADDWVVSFYADPRLYDEFNVTITNGSKKVVKTFKISELNVTDEDYGVSHYILKLSDLNITEAGEYLVTANFKTDGKLLSNNGTVTVTDDLEINFLEQDEYNQVSQVIFAIWVSEDMKGFIRVYVDDVQVGGNISLQSLNFGGWGPDKGRQVLLNHFNISKNDNYNLKVEVYDETGNLLNQSNAKISVEVGENTVNITDIYYTNDEKIFEFSIGSPIPEGSYFIIYLNGKKAGIWNISKIDVEFDDDFMDVYAEYGKYLKVGDYTVSIKLCSGENVTDFANDTLSVKSLNVTTDKDNYFDNQNITISFKDNLPEEGYGELSVRLIRDWAFMGPDDEEIITISGNDLKKIYKDGVFTLNLGNLKAGKNYIWILYRWADSKGDMNNEEYLRDARDLITVNVTEQIDPKLTISIDDIALGSDAVIKITTNSTFSGNVDVEIGNGKYPVTVTNGIGSCKVSNLIIGTYNATAKFNSVGIFKDSTATTQFSVKANPNITVSISDVFEGSDIVITITANSTCSGNVTVYIGNGAYPVAVVNGTGSGSFKNNLKAANYTAVAKFSGNDVFGPITKNAEFTVKAKIATIIGATNVTTTYATSKDIIVTLTDANGNSLVNKTVTVVLNGVTKTLTTDAKGQATFSIGTKLVPKIYAATIVFDGDATYSGSVVSAKVVVNKAKPKLTAKKKKTFKVKTKTKKYKIVLKTDKKKAIKKVKVTLKIKGLKTIKAKTNAKGKAVFKIKKLTKKGKFKATVKFKGSKCYKAVSKKVKIIVK